MRERLSAVVGDDRGDQAGGDGGEDDVAVARTHIVVAARRGSQMASAPVIDHDITRAEVAEAVALAPVMPAEAEVGAAIVRGRRRAPMPGAAEPVAVVAAVVPAGVAAVVAPVAAVAVVVIAIVVAPVVVVIAAVVMAVVVAAVVATLVVVVAVVAVLLRHGGGSCDRCGQHHAGDSGEDDAFHVRLLFRSTCVDVRPINVSTHELLISLRLR